MTWSGETKGYDYEDTAVCWLERKAEYCREHLQLQAVLAPGLSEYRAYISGIHAESVQGQCEYCREHIQLQAVYSHQDSPSTGPIFQVYRVRISTRTV